MSEAQKQLQAVFQSTMECVAAVCDELEPAFPDVAPAAAHFFRHGATGVLAEGVDVQLVGQFREAFVAALGKKKHRHLAVFLAAGIDKPLQLGVAFAVGDLIANAPPPPADAPAPKPLIPMVLIGKSRHYANEKATTTADQIAYRNVYRDRAFRHAANAALRTHFTTQVAEPPAVALPDRVIAALNNANAVYAAGVAASAGRRHDAWPCALWNFQVTDFTIQNVAVAVYKRTLRFSFALFHVKFDHDGSELHVMLQREIPQLLDQWRQRPTPRQPLRLQYMSPMQVVAASAEHRYFALSNVAGSPVSVAPQLGDDAAAE